MRPFNLNEYLSNPNLKVVTRMGKSVRIVSTDFHSGSKDKCVLALVTFNTYGDEIPITYFNNGKTFKSTTCSDDLFFAEDSSVHIGYVNLYLNSDGFYTGQNIYDTEQEAKNVCDESLYYTTLRIEWE